MPDRNRQAGVSGQAKAGLQALFDEASTLAARANWTGAESIVRRLLAAAPDSPHVLILASSVMLGRGHYREARALALQLAPPLDEPRVLMQAVRVLRRFEEPAVMRRLVAGSRWQSIVQLPVLAELALHLCSSGEYPLARECIDRMLGIDPRCGDAHYLLGLLEMFAGRKEHSLAALDRALTIEPRMANAHWLVAMQDDRSRAEAHVAIMQRVLPGIRSGSEAQAYLYYSLHHRLHSLGRHADAWQTLVRGMAVMRGLTPYRREEHHALFQALQEMTLPRYAPTPQPAGQPGLIFIVGMFRSGTTLIERVLAGHPDVADGGETYQFSAGMRDATNHDSPDVIDAAIVSRASTADFDIVRHRMHAYAAWRSGGKKWLTEKLPSNFLNLGFILHALPEAKILHLRRDPVETGFSNLRTIFRGAAPYACDQADMADYYLRYSELMAHWHAVAPGRILDVNYSDFVESPEVQARRLLEYCGLEYVEDILDVGRQEGQTATASAAHARQGILKNRGDAWKPYATELQPLIRGLAID